MKFLYNVYLWWERFKLSNTSHLRCKSNSSQFLTIIFIFTAEYFSSSRRVYKELGIFRSTLILWNFPKRKTKFIRLLYTPIISFAFIIKDQYLSSLIPPNPLSIFFIHRFNKRVSLNHPQKRTKNHPLRYNKSFSTRKIDLALTHQIYPRTNIRLTPISRMARRNCRPPRISYPISLTSACYFKVSRFQDDFCTGRCAYSRRNACENGTGSPVFH